MNVIFIFVGLWILAFIPTNCKVIFTPITEPKQLTQVAPKDNLAPFSTAITEYVDPTDNEKYYYVTTLDDDLITIFDIYDNNLTQYNNQNNKNLSDIIPYIISNQDGSYLGGINVCTTPKSGNIIECMFSPTTLNSTCRIFINGINKWTAPFRFGERMEGFSTPAVGTVCLDDDNFLIVYDDKEDIMQLKYTVLSIDEDQQIIIHNTDILTLKLDESNINCTDLSVEFDFITKSNFKVNGVDNVINTLLFPFECFNKGGSYYSFSGYYKNTENNKYQLLLMDDSYNALGEYGASIIPTKPIILEMNSACCYLFAYYYQEDIVTNPMEAGVVIDYKGNNVAGGVITFDRKQVEPRYAFVNLEMLNHNTSNTKYFAEIGAIFTGNLFAKIFTLSGSKPYRVELVDEVENLSNKYIVSWPIPYVLNNELCVNWQADGTAVGKLEIPYARIFKVSIE